MTDILAKIKNTAAVLGEAAVSEMDLDVIQIEAGAIRNAVPYLKDKGYRAVSVVSDANTLQAAGQTLLDDLAAAGLDGRLTLIKPDKQGDVIADEASIVQLLLDIQQYKTQIVVAAGSGTLHDISRYAAFTAGLPFVSVPTAPSVDGFNSKGAPIIIRGEKKTIQAIGPDAIFADLDILTKAPGPMVAAGFGDMLGKYTSLFDWTFGSLTAGEPFNETVYKITEEALLACVDSVDAIAKRDEAGIRILIGSLIESGLAMLLFGQSHSASGAEHHLSHYWEMTYIREGRRQLLHGAKVGVACAEIADLYHRIAENGLPDSPDHPGIAANWARIRDEAARIPDADTIRGLLRTVGGPAEIAELGVEPELLAESLREAHHVRLNRFTLLRAYNEAAVKAPNV